MKQPRNEQMSRPVKSEECCPAGLDRLLARTSNRETREAMAGELLAMGLNIESVKRILRLEEQRS